jgi:hypothetical protein
MELIKFDLGNWIGASRITYKKGKLSHGQMLVEKPERKFTLGTYVQML